MNHQVFFCFLAMSLNSKFFIGAEAFNAVIVADVPRGLRGELNHCPGWVCLVTVVDIPVGNYILNIYGWKKVRVPYTVSFALPNIDIRLLSEFYSYIEEEIPEKTGSRKRRTPPQDRKQIPRSVVVGRPKKQPRCSDGTFGFK